MNVTYDRYEQYESRMLALSRILRWIVKHCVILSITLAVIVATLVFLGVVPGMFVEEAACEDCTYGEKPVYTAEALLSKISFEFTSEQGEEAVWTADVPVRAGTYRVRALAKNGYGKTKYSEEATFTIHPAALRVKVKDAVQLYGEKILYGTDRLDILGLVDGDRVDTAEFLFEDLSVDQKSVSVSGLTLMNAAGENVGNCYSTQFTPGLLSFSPRPVTFASEDASKDYDGTPLSQPTCSLTEGSLVEGDVVEYIHDSTSFVTVPGEDEARFEVRITDEEGRDVTKNEPLPHRGR